MIVINEKHHFEIECSFSHYFMNAFFGVYLFVCLFVYNVIILIHMFKKKTTHTYAIKYIHKKWMKGKTLWRFLLYKGQVSIDLSVICWILKILLMDK